ncbi:MAG: hypothetical protein KDA54_17030 [Phycisphaerales bacterium]|nr:hypothetical protein [Phycisphaerales bacterium]
MQRVRILVARHPEGPSDVAVEWFGDLGGGTVDHTRLLPPGRQKLWPECAPHVGHLLVGHLMVGHVDTVRDDGHLEVLHLGDGHLQAGFALVLESPRYVFGRFRHALRMLDGAGNATGDDALVFAHTVNSSPPVPQNLRRSQWNAATSQLEFMFTPVRFKPIVGN